MKETAAAERYSRALFLALKDQKSSDFSIALRQLAKAVDLLRKDQKFREALENPLIAMDRKKQVLKKNASDFSSLVLNFLNLIVSKKRIRLLPLILSRFE